MSTALTPSASSTTCPLENRFIEQIAQEIACRPRQVRAAADLFADGATVPFVARYRKEVTGGLLDEQLEVLAKRREYFLELSQRRDTILESIAEQGKLTDELAAAIRAAGSKQELEDLYLPYKKKRRTRAQIARERGLEPLAEALLDAARKGAAVGGASSPADLAATYVDVDKEIPDADIALAGARDILAEQLAENAEHRAGLRNILRRESVLQVRVISGKEEEGAVYRDYFEYREPAREVASHRMLAVLRGEREGVLLSDLELDDDARTAELAASWGAPLSTPWGEQLRLATADGYKRLLRPSITNEVRSELRQQAETEAINVFRANLEALLLQAPLGQLAVMGLDPGLRTGCKLAVVDRTGRVAHTATIFPIPPRPREAEASQEILSALKRFEIKAVAIGNGTGSRETEAFVRRIVQEASAADTQLQGITVAIVPETGASVYSASETARQELPDLDVSLRGAVSIARRLQDPLAELVKIEPKSLGVGQYQHDVDQRSLAQELDLAVEGAVNRVGVELNTASASLLRRISGLTDRLARAVIEYRDIHGAFDSRKTLLSVPGLGPKTFEQAAGFLRVREGKHPLDRTAVHPERYTVVERMAQAMNVPLEELVGNHQLVSRLDLSTFEDADQGLGSYTLQDIRDELEKPGRDPRPEFKAPEWRADVVSVADLQPGMILEGRVSNVTNFGAFVDIGVKRDGLVHLSELSSSWVDDPRTVVKVGQIVKVKVLEVDRQRERIGLSIKALQGGSSAPSGNRPEGSRTAGGRTSRPPATQKPASVQDLMRRFNKR